MHAHVNNIKYVMWYILPASGSILILFILNSSIIKIASQLCFMLHI